MSKWFQLTVNWAKRSVGEERQLVFLHFRSLLWKTFQKRRTWCFCVLSSCRTLSKPISCNHSELRGRWHFCKIKWFFCVMCLKMAVCVCVCVIKKTCYSQRAFLYLTPSAAIKGFQQYCVVFVFILNNCSDYEHLTVARVMASNNQPVVTPAKAKCKLFCASTSMHGAGIFK